MSIKKLFLALALISLPLSAYAEGTSITITNNAAEQLKSYSTVKMSFPKAQQPKSAEVVKAQEETLQGWQKEVENDTIQGSVNRTYGNIANAQAKAEETRQSMMHSQFDMEKQGDHIKAVEATVFISGNNLAEVRKIARMGGDKAFQFAMMQRELIVGAQNSALLQSMDLTSKDNQVTIGNFLAMQEYVDDIQSGNNKVFTDVKADITTNKNNIAENKVANAKNTLVRNRDKMNEATWGDNYRVIITSEDTLKIIPDGTVEGIDEEYLTFYYETVPGKLGEDDRYFFSTRSGKLGAGKTNGALYELFPYFHNPDGTYLASAKKIRDWKGTRDIDSDGNFVKDQKDFNQEIQKNTDTNVQQGKDIEGLAENDVVLAGAIKNNANKNAQQDKDIKANAEKIEDNAEAVTDMEKDVKTAYSLASYALTPEDITTGDSGSWKNGAISVRGVIIKTGGNN